MARLPRALPLAGLGLHARHSHRGHIEAWHGANAAPDFLHFRVRQLLYMVQVKLCTSTAADIRICTRF